MVPRVERRKSNEEESVNQNPTVNSSCTKERVNVWTGGVKVSEGKAKLNEIAEVLLMLKQKKRCP